MKKKIAMNFQQSQKNEPYYFIFDTETSGLPRSRSADYKELNNWPRILQFAFLLFDELGMLINGYYIYIIQQQG